MNSEAQLNSLLDEKLPFSPSAERMAAARAEVRELGKRATPARLTTLLFLRSQSRPVSHAEVAKGLESLGFDKATVFRNLNDLCEWDWLKNPNWETMSGDLKLAAPDHTEASILILFVLIAEPSPVCSKFNSREAALKPAEISGK